MKKYEEYYNKTKRNISSVLLRIFFNMGCDKELCGNTAVDLGAGAGNDARFLTKKGFNIICIDKEEKSKQSIMEQNIKNIEFELQEFENLKLDKADLIYSFLSLNFCNPDKFNNMMDEIISSIKLF